MRMLIWWVCLPLLTEAQNDWEQLMQPNNVLLHKTSQSNPFIHFTSIGGLAFSNSNSIGISVENKYLIKSLSKLNIGAQVKTRNGGIGTHLNAMSNEIFSGISAGINYGIRLSNSFGIGVGVKARRDQFRGFLPIFFISPQLGLMYLFSNKGSIGISLKKLIKPTATPVYKEFANISSTINYQIADQIHVAIELVNDLRNTSNLNLYAEWSPSNHMDAYLYYHTSSAEIQCGMSYNLKRVKMGIGISNHNYLGNSGYIMFYHGF